MGAPRNTAAPAARLDAGLVERMVAIRRDLHRHPELSGAEERTSGAVADRLGALGLASRRLGETGLIADIPAADGTTDGPKVALRADMDALPISEETGLPFASRNPGVMHACGHDGHTSILLGAAEALLAAPAPAPVRLLFQPAEEIARGARALIKDGALDGVAFVFGVHLDVSVDTGRLLVTEGPVNAALDNFQIRLVGQGAHAARPHHGVDAVVAGSALVMALQTVVSRELDPADRAVVTVGSFHAGTAKNVIAEEAVLEGTLRSQSPDVRRQLRDGAERLARAVAETHRARAEVEIFPGPPALINRPAPTALARTAAERTVGAGQIGELAKANLGGEDFAEYLEHVDGCFIRVGAAHADRPNSPQHSSRFDFDEAALEVGARYFRHVAHVAGASLRS
ncbi:MAG: amidohydrolase [Acidobacteriota bacterium]